MSKIPNYKKLVVRGDSIPVEPRANVGPRKIYRLPKGTIIWITDIIFLPKSKSAISILHHPRLKKLEGTIALVENRFLNEEYLKDPTPVILEVGGRYFTTRNLTGYNVLNSTVRYKLKKGTFVECSGIDSDNKEPPKFNKDIRQGLTIWFHFSKYFDPKKHLEKYRLS